MYVGKFLKINGICGSRHIYVFIDVIPVTDEVDFVQVFSWSELVLLQCRLDAFHESLKNTAIHRHISVLQVLELGSVYELINLCGNVSTLGGVSDRNYKKADKHMIISATPKDLNRSVCNECILWYNMYLICDKRMDLRTSLIHVHCLW